VTGHQGAYTLQDRLQVLSKTNGRGIVTTYEYDEYGNRTKKTEAVGTPEERVTTWTYEPNSARIATITKQSVVDPTLTTATSYTYDTNGNILTITQTGQAPGGITESAHTYTYDTKGRILSIDGPAPMSTISQSLPIIAMMFPRGTTGADCTP